MRKNHLSFLLCLILAFTVCFTPLFAQAETTTTTAAQNANLSITAKAKETTLVGTNKTTITYTITNTGNVRLTNVVLKDEDIAGSKTIGSVDTLNVGASKTYTYEASFTRTSTSKPVVTCKAGSQTKTFTGASQKIVMGASKLSAALKADSTTVESGKKTSFTLTLKNDGTSTISNITITNPSGTTLKEKISVRAGNSTDVALEDTVSQGEYYVTVSGKDSSGDSVETESNKLNMTVQTTTEETVNVKEGLTVTLSSDRTSLEKADKVKLTIELQNTTKQEYQNIEIIDKATNKSIQTVDTLAAGDTKTLTSEIDLKETTRFQYQVKAKAADGTDVSLDSNTVEVSLNKQGMSMMTIFLIIIAIIVVLIIITGTTLFVLSRKEKKKKKEAASRISQKYRPAPEMDDTPQHNGFMPEQPSGGTPLSTFTIEPEEQPSQQTMPLNIPRQSSDFSTSDYEPHPAVEQPQRPIQVPPVTPPPQQAPPQQPRQPQPQPKNSKMDYNDLDPDR